jgi:hypothetical protein
LKVDDLNPYAAPSIPAEPTSGQLDALAASGGCWRDGRYVVAPLRANLPDRCAKTNEPAIGYYAIQLTWFPAWTMLFLLLGPLVFVAMFFAARTISVRVPFGQQVQQRRWRHVRNCLIAAAICLILSSGYGLTVGNATGYFGAGVVAALICLVVAASNSQQLSILNATSQFVWINGAGPEFLNSLPPWTPEEEVAAEDMHAEDIALKTKSPTRSLNL